MGNKLFITVIFLIYIKLMSQNGTLDNSFNSIGLKKEKNISSNSLCTDKNNKTLVYGHDNIASPYNIYVRRYLQDGTVDSTFANNGLFVNDLNNDRDYGRCIQALDNGKYLLSGQNSLGPYFRTFVMRLKNNGAIDSSFGRNGYFIMDDNNGNSDAWNFEVSATGSIYIAGYKTVSGEMKSVLWKLKGNGGLDSSFGLNGEKLLITNSYGERLFDLALRGNIIGVAGYSHNGSVQEGIVALLDTNGNLDTGFNKKGYCKVRFNNNETYLRSIGFLNDGRPAVGGAFVPIGGAYHGLVAVFKTNGIPDSSFSGDGSFDFSKISFVSAVLADCDNNIFTGGYVAGTGGQYNISIKKITGKGTADANFGVNSEFTARYNSTNDEIIETINFSGPDKIIFAGRISGDSIYFTGIGIISVEPCAKAAVKKMEDIKGHLLVYPNPFSGRETLTICIDGSIIEEVAEIEIINTEGKRHLLVNGPLNQGRLDIGKFNLAPGIYILKISSGEAYYYQKLIIE
jgi:uncharacterized delta-60 repeat protein